MLIGKGARSFRLMRSPGIFNSGCWFGAFFRMACLKWRQDSMYGTARANAEPATGAVFLPGRV